MADLCLWQGANEQTLMLFIFSLLMPCLTRESLKGNYSVDRGFKSHEQS